MKARIAEWVAQLNDFLNFESREWRAAARENREEMRKIVKELEDKVARGEYPPNGPMLMMFKKELWGKIKYKRP